jgi:hypothetical protein
MIKLDNAPIDPFTGEPFWVNEWDVYRQKVSDYLNHTRLPYCIETSEFIWGPSEYPTNSDGSYSFWDEKKIPVRFDGETKYYDPET